jgi:predicted phosphodiesterase
MKHYSISWRWGQLVLVFILSGCIDSIDQPVGAEFQHDVNGEELPWTNENFDSGNDKFTFAVFSDLTGGERPRIFEIAVAQLSLLRPELIINVGDLIEGGTDDLGEIDQQWDSFDQRADRARAPIFYVGGNHDLTGTVLRKVWGQRYGPSYYHFVYKNVLFLVLDTEDNTPERMQEILEARNRAIEVAETEGWDAFAQTEYANMPENAAGNISAEQSRYFQDVIAANPDVRWTFLFMHKAAWRREEVHTFAVIEQALSERPYTVFNGHVHAYEHEKRHGRDYIRLATTGGVQFPDLGRSADHVTLVTVSESGADIANLLMDGILDKTGHIPLGGDDVCFEIATCGEAE